MVGRALFDKGWLRFPTDLALTEWAKAARQAALPLIADPDQQRQWLYCEGTWFVGVDTLPNQPDGALAGAGVLPGAAIAMARELYGDIPLHRGQVSVIYPGYPRPRDGEGEAAFRYRLHRDAAHVDGLHAIGADRQRKLLERHAYILGIPLNQASSEASPLTIWEGSHKIMHRAFAAALQDQPKETWEKIDLTAVYHKARREVFATCPRVPVTARLGESYLIHRLALHGVAPWKEGATAPDEGRMIAYFRPEWPGHSGDWLAAP